MKIVSYMLILIALCTFSFARFADSGTFAIPETRYGCGCEMTEHPSCNLTDNCPGWVICGKIGDDCDTRYNSYQDTLDCIVSDNNPGRECKDPKNEICYFKYHCKCVFSWVPPFMYCDGKGTTKVQDDPPNPVRMSCDYCK